MDHLKLRESFKDRDRVSHKDSEKQIEYAHVATVGCEGNVTNSILVFSHIFLVINKVRKRWIYSEYVGGS